MEAIAKNRAIADAGFLFALINKKDSNHQKAKEAAANHASRKWITSCFVFHEVFHLLRSRDHSHIIPYLFDMGISELLEVFKFEKVQLIELRDIIEKYPKIDLADASLICLAGVPRPRGYFYYRQKRFLNMSLGADKDFQYS
jgi:uncharacterized protein